MLVALSACAGCARSLGPEAEAYVQLVLALGQRDGDSLDFYTGPPEWMAEARANQRTLADIGSSATTLLQRVEHSRADDPTRQAFLVRQLRAVVARIDVLSGRRLPFDQESRVLFGVTADDGDPVPAERIRDDLDQALPGDGSLGHRYAAFERRFLIPRVRVPVVMTRAIEGCRRVTLAQIDLPAGERVYVEYTGGLPWSAFTRYEGSAHSRIQINTDFDLTVDRALQLACHEAYPGHHTINTLIDTRLVGPVNRVELSVQPMFSPQSLRTEGAATFAPELAFSGDARLAFERDELFPLAGLNPADAEPYLRVSALVDRLRGLQAGIARRYLDGNLEFVRAAIALEDETLMPSPAPTLKFLNQFRTYAVTYTIGRDLVAREVGTEGDPGTRWRAFERWVMETK
jgi:hypothetical protein